MIRWWFVVLLMAAVTVSPSVQAADDGLAQAERNYPPLIEAGTVHAVDGSGPIPPACPVAGSVQQRGGPTIEYLGSVGGEPELCAMRIGGRPVQAWFGVWQTIWPGADQAHVAIGKLLYARSGTMIGFDVNMGPGHVYHDVLRNEGVEELVLRGQVYSAMKISHYREGAEGNLYRSVTTGWKDLASGMLIYVSYQHISGTPELDVPLIPTAILPLGNRQQGG